MEKLNVLGKKAKVAAPKKDVKDIKEALKPLEVKHQDAPKPQVTKAA
jgi:hypothetical protein